MKKVFKAIISIILILLVGFSIYLAYQINSNVTNLVSQEATIENEKNFLNKYHINLENFRENNKYKKEMVKNEKEDYSFQIDTYNLQEKDKVFIFLHAMGGTGNTTIPICKEFLDRGYACITYDQRNSGLHPKKKNTMGIKEKDDLISLINHLKKEYPKKEINIFAISYGGQTFLQAYPSIKNHINKIILDSPVANAQELIEIVMKETEEEVGLPYQFMLKLGDLASNIAEDYSYEDTNSIKKIDSIDNPILVIASKNDEVVPFSQAKSIYDKASGKKILLESESKHADMFFAEKDRYMEGIDEFLEK